MGDPIVGVGLARSIAFDGSNYVVALKSSPSNLVTAQFLGPTADPFGAPINLAEAIDVCRRVHGLMHDDIRGVVEPLTVSNTLGVGVSDEHDAWLAAELRSEHYDRKTCVISIADCFAASSQDPGELDLRQLLRIEDRKESRDDRSTVRGRT